MIWSAFDEFAIDRLRFRGTEYAIQQSVSDAPFLPICVEGHCFVIETYDLAAALPMVMIKEADGIADGHFMSAQPLQRIVPDCHIDTLKIDGGIGDQSVLAGIGFTNQHFLSPDFRRAGKLAFRKSSASSPANAGF